MVHSFPTQVRVDSRLPLSRTVSGLAVIATLPTTQQLGLLHQLLDVVPHAVWLSRANGVVEHMNRPAREYFVGSCETPSGWNWLDAIHNEDRTRFDAMWIDNGGTKFPFTSKMQVRRSDGAYRWFLIRVHLTVWTPGQPKWWMVTGTEITGGRVEGDVRRWERRYEALLEALHGRVWTTDTGGDILAEFGSLTGTNTGTEVPSAVHSGAHIHPDDRALVQTAWSEANGSGQTFKIECRLFRDNEWRIVEIRGQPLRDTEGGIEGWIGVTNDMTDLRRNEAALRRCERRYQSLITALDQMVAVTDSQSQAFEIFDHGSILGPDVASTPSDWFARIHPDDRERAETAWDEGMTTGQESEAEYRIRRHDGEWRSVASRMVPVHDERGHVVEWVGVVDDVTDLRRAESDLQRSERRYRTLIAASAKIVWAVSSDGRVAVVHGADTFYGGDETTIPLEAWFDSMHPDDRQRVRSIWQDEQRIERSFQVEYRLRTIDGTYRRMLGRAVPVRDDAGRIDEWVGTVEDVTELRRVEEELRLSERRYRTLVTATAQIVWVMNSSGEPTLVHGSELFFGTNASALTMAAWMDRIHPDDRGRVRAAVATAVGNEQPLEAEYRLRRQDGKWRQVSARGVPVRNEDGLVEEWVGVTADMTEARQMEEQFRQAQKMDAVGRLAGGIAHDFNNLLTVINGYAELALSGRRSDEPTRRCLRKILNAGERSAGLTQQLLSFSRRQVLEPIVLDLNDVARRSESLIRRLLGEDIRFTALYDAALPRVRVDPSQIEQVIMNLAVNARDAMPTGGQLTLETNGVVVSEAGLPGEPDVRPGHYAQLTVTDTGHGMTSTVKAQLFEPFFTTKEAGKGTGLGLAVVHGVVKQSGGHISVYSEVNIGTTFRLMFPAVDAALTRMPTRDLAPPNRGSETVLLVEDEESVRLLAQISLENQGYVVLTAATGQEAMRIAEQHSDVINLLLTDVVMPEMGGRELAEALRKRMPNLRVLYMSGYTDDAVVRHGIIESSDSFLQKPYTPTTLANKVRAVIDQLC